MTSFLFPRSSIVLRNPLLRRCPCNPSFGANPNSIIPCIKSDRTRERQSISRCLTRVECRGVAGLYRDSWQRGSGSRRQLGVRCQATQWTSEKSPYETLELGFGATEEEVKVAYRKMAKRFHPDVYDGSTELSEGETAESRFIQVQAAYELLMDSDERRKYDFENRENPMKASKAWMEWVMKKRRAFEQRGDLAVSAWAEQQQRELSMRARNLAKAKMDPEEERRLMERQRQASLQSFETTLKRHNLVLKKRDIVRRRAEDSARKLLVQDLLAAEGLEIEDEQK